MSILKFLIVTLGPYIRKDPTVLQRVKSNTEKGMSLEQAYIENNMLQCDPTNIVNIKSAQNISHSLNKSQKEVNPKSEENERVKENTFVKSLKFEHDIYHTFNFKAYMLKDMERFCIKEVLN